mmetsp:Transcript_55192/g.118624  ORF Transcript_55192/g.118624 Transcript_55192/m.118624 type:complete len:443 (+) Transcript_55192:295-1623(+)
MKRGSGVASPCDRIATMRVTKQIAPGTMRNTKVRAVRAWLSPPKSEEKTTLRNSEKGSTTLMQDPLQTGAAPPTSSSMPPPGHPQRQWSSVETREAWIAARLPPAPFITGAKGAKDVKRCTACLRMRPPQLLMSMDKTTGVQPSRRTAAVCGFREAKRAHMAASRAQAIMTRSCSQCKSVRYVQNRSAIMASSDKVQKSPSMPAIGEATLSGFTPQRCDKSTMAIITVARSTDAMPAAATALEAKRRQWLGRRRPLVRKFMAMATRAASSPTTTAWHSTTMRFPKMMLMSTPCSPSKWPMLACVDKREANVISRLPFKPKRAGTKMRISRTSTKTSHRCTRPSRSPAATMPSPATRNGGKTCSAVPSKPAAAADGVSCGAIASKLGAAADGVFSAPPRSSCAATVAACLTFREIQQSSSGLGPPRVAPTKASGVLAANALST